MQYVRSISGSVSKTWNSINPATLSGAIDVIVIEQEDGTLENKMDSSLLNLKNMGF
jgi:phosphatidate phosphatase LPIN